MLVNWRQGYVFIHVPKTGGTSIRQVLKRHCDRPPALLRACGYAFDHAGYTLPEPLFPLIGYPYHARACDLQRLWGPRFSHLFSFCFVRNPWDLVVSEYHFIRRKWDHPKRRQVRALGSFDAFVSWKANTGYHTNQVDWFTGDDGLILVDRVARFEHFAHEAADLFRHIGQDVVLPHANHTVHRDYRCLYGDRTASLVGDMYARDIAALGYRFG